MSFRFLPFILLLHLLFPLQVSGQGEIRGRIVTDEGEGLAGANVTLLVQPLYENVRGAVTDGNGEFVFTGLRLVEHKIRASFVGYSTVELSVLPGAPQSESFVIVLARAAIQSDPIVVIASRSDPIEGAVTTSSITARQLDELPQMQDTPMHLSSRPSITSYTESGNGIGYTYMSMRGFGQRRIAVSINGIAQNDPETFDVFWINFFDLEDVVSDIQVQRGASGSVYGSTGVGGAINIVTDPFTPFPKINVEVGRGSFGTAKYGMSASSGLLGDRLVLFGKASRLETNGYRDWSWSKFWRFFGGARLIGDRSSLTIQGFGGRQNDALTYLGIPKAANTVAVGDGFGGLIDRRSNPSSAAQEVERFHQPHLHLRHRHSFDDGLELDQTLFAVKGKGYFDFDASFRSANYLRLPDSFVGGSNRDQPLFIARNDITPQSVLFRAFLDQWQIGWQPKLEIDRGKSKSLIGLEARLHRSLKWGRIQSSDIIPDDYVGDSDYRVYSFRAEKLVSSVFASHQRQLSTTVSLKAELLGTAKRYRVYDEDFFNTEFSKPYLFVNPRVGINVRPSESLSAYASIAFSQREPRLKALYDGEEAGAGFQPLFQTDDNGDFDYGKPVVKAEKLLNGETGFRYSTRRAFAAVNLYLMEFRDEIVPSGGLDQFGIPRTGNADKTRHLGVELETRMEIHPTTEWYLSLMRSRNRFSEFVEYGFDGVGRDRSGNPIAGFPDQAGYSSLTLRKSGLSLIASITFAGRQFIDNSAGILATGEQVKDLELDAYWHAGLSLRYHFEDASLLRGLDLSVDVNNLTDRSILLAGNEGFGVAQFYPYAGRHVYARMRYNFN